MRDEDAAITLRVLTAIESKNVVTQRAVARELGIALGLANAYLKRCVAKGLIKVAQIPARRYAYYLTPQGFAEKSQLAAQYLSNSLAFVRLAREQCEGAITECESRGWRRVILAGASEIADVATLCAKDRGVVILGILDVDGQSGSRSLLPILDRLEGFENLDAAIVTDCRGPQAAYDLLAAQFDRERILTLPLLHISRERPSE
jgi:DNA-binding MarR family transcriptional regulator